MATPRTNRMKALLAVESPRDRALFADCLAAYRIPARLLDAKDSLLDVYRKDLPQLVIVDCDWQDECSAVLRQLRSLRPVGRFLHILMLASASQQTSNLYGLRYVQDLLYRPCAEWMVKKKVQQALLLCAMHARLARQRQRTADAEYELERYQSAGEILNTLVEPCRQYHTNVKHLFLPASELSGDLLLVEHPPGGHQYVLLGDITGHGFAAFMATLPLTQFYNELIGKTAHLGELVQELNQLICRYLPCGVFAAVAIVELDHSRRRLRIWNGGLPDALIWRAAQGRLEAFPSKHCAMGVLPDIETDFYETYLAADDTIYLCTDGLIEARNRQEQPFTQTRLEACLLACDDVFERFDHVCLELNRFIGDVSPHDDITFIEIAPHAN